MKYARKRFRWYCLLEGLINLKKGQISIALCTLSKVFEKIMYNRLIKFIDKFSILYEYQFCFRRKRPTHMAQISLIDKITQAIENGEYDIGEFLDFSKAFDTVDHKIPLDHRVCVGGLKCHITRSYDVCAFLIVYAVGVW